jgi:hypothetical protein
MTMRTADHPRAPVEAANDRCLRSTGSVQTEALKLSLLSIIDQAMDTEVQREASQLLNFISAAGPTIESWAIILIEPGITALRSNHHNVGISKFVRNRLEVEYRNKRPGFVPWVSRKLSDSPVYAMIIGAISSGLIWILLFVVVLAVSSELNTLFKTSFYMPPDEIKPLAFAAFTGSLISLLSRVDKFANLYIFDPFLVFLNSFLKPLIGTVLAITIYAILKSNLCYSQIQYC